MEAGQAQAERVDGERPALTQEESDQMWEFVDSSGDDPPLDCILCETIVIAGARVEGLFNLTLGGSTVTSALLLDEKRQTRAYRQPQPVPVVSVGNVMGL